MKLQWLKQEFRRIAIKAGLIGFVVLLVVGYSLYDRQTREDQLAQIQQDTALARNRISKLEQENNQFIQTQLKYNRIPLTQREQNLNDLPSRIALLQPLLQTLKVRYRLAVLDISLTNVAPYVSTTQQTTFSTAFNTVTLTFGGLSDEMVVSFLLELFETLPGYIRVESLEMKRELDITPSVLSQIQSRSIPVIVSGKVTFSWKTVRR